VNAYGVKAGWFIPFVEKSRWQVKLCDPVSDIAMFVLKRDIKLRQTNLPVIYRYCLLVCVTFIVALSLEKILQQRRIPPANARNLLKWRKGLELELTFG